GMIRNVEEVRTGNREENNDAFSDIQVNSYTKEAGTELLSSGHFKKSELPRTGGSILGLLDEEIGKWKREVIITGDFNEVRFKSDRFGSNFNGHGAQLFNSFFSGSGLVEVTLGGSHFTWC
nr:RNA-directed DNA polymerase, eukaryota [Tanacetum cinerariifolium]